MLHVPVKQENSDARTAKERMKEGCRVCGVRFTNTDSFAVCSVLDERSRPVSVKNCHGGNAYRYHCKTLLKKIEASKVFTDKDNVDQPNKKYYMRYKHLNEHYAHQVSREILDFCKENQAGIIVLPEYDEDFYRMTMYRSGNDSPLHLSTKIRNYLKYKAWAEGILVLELRADETEKYCSMAHITSAEKINPIIYPPAFPRRDPIPPENPANTGTPTAPRRTYTRTARVPLFPPSTPTAINTPNVCRVNGTCAGIEIHEQTAITTAKTAI